MSARKLAPHSPRSPDYTHGRDTALFAPARAATRRESDLFYANLARTRIVYSLYDDSDKPQYRSGGMMCGLLSTARELLSAGDPRANFVAIDPATSAVLWHAGLQPNVSDVPPTYEPG